MQGVLFLDEVTKSSCRSQMVLSDTARSADFLVLSRFFWPTPRMISPISVNWTDIGFVVRHNIPIVRLGAGLGNLTIETSDKRASRLIPISGMSVTPIPAPTICTRVEREFPSINRCGRTFEIWHTVRAYLENNAPLRAITSASSGGVWDLGFSFLRPPLVEPAQILLRTAQTP